MAQERADRASLRQAAAEGTLTDWQRQARPSAGIEND